MKDSGQGTKVKPGDGPSDRRKAWKLRKVAKKKTLSKENETWLKEYTENTAGNSPNAGVTRDATPTDNGSPQAGDHTDAERGIEPEPPVAAATPEPDPGSTGAGKQGTAHASALPFPAHAAPPVPNGGVGKLPPLPRLPPPPRVSTEAPPEPTTTADSKRGTGGADWRAKYKGAAGVDREQTVLLIAGQWIDLMRVFEAQLKLVGETPLVPVDMLVGAIVLTVDDVLPANIVITPKATALLGTTALCAQRFLSRAKISDALRNKDETAAYEASKAKHSPLVSVPMPPAESATPTPTPPAPPVVVPDAQVVLEWAEPERPIL